MHNEKQKLEIGALTQFSEALAVMLGDGRFIFHELRDPPQPDAYCSFDGQSLHVEVGHIYGTQSDVKQLLGRSGRSAAKQTEMANARMIPLDERLITPLNALLYDK